MAPIKSQKPLHGTLHAHFWYPFQPGSKLNKITKMYMKKLINFKDQNLNIDYLTLNVPNSVGRILEFAEIFFKYGFNSKVFMLQQTNQKSFLKIKSYTTLLLLDWRVILGTKKQCLFNFQSLTLVVYIF